MSETTANPAISVLVPIYNVERYLAECLDSLVGQSFGDFEVICLNDGSTDGSREIIQRYLEADQRFRVIDKPNSGYGATMNIGLAEARGDYVTILESDDWIEPETLAVLHQHATGFGAEVAKANFYFYWSLPTPRDEFAGLLTPEMSERLVDPQTEHDIFYLKPSIWSALYRRDFLGEHSIDFLETPGASYQDAGFNFKVWASARAVVFIHQAYLHYRQDNETSSVNSPGKVYCVNDEYAEMDRYLAGQPDKAYLQSVKAKMKYDSYIWNYERLAEQFRGDFLRRMQAEFLTEVERGNVDWQLFEPWKKDALELILESPDAYHATRQAGERRGLARKALYYLKVGGPALLWRIIRRKLA